MAPTELTQLAEQISSQVAVLTNLLEKIGHPQPSSAVDGPNDYPDNLEVQEVRMKLAEAASSVRMLALGPQDVVIWDMLAV
jgi:hypothetical protein